MQILYVLCIHISFIYESYDVSGGAKSNVCVNNSDEANPSNEQD